MKVVIHTGYGSFRLPSHQVAEALIKAGWSLTTYNEEGEYIDQDAKLALDPESEYDAYYLCDDSLEIRSDSVLIQVVEDLNKAKVDTELAVVEIPDGTNFCIEDYDGREWIAEAHRTWS